MERDLTALIKAHITKYGQEAEQQSALSKEAYAQGKLAEYHKRHRAYLIAQAKQDALIGVLSAKTK